MHWSEYCWSLVLFALACTAVFLFRRVYLDPLSAFPGPKLAAASSFVQFHVLWTGREKAWYQELHRKYGPVVRCGPNHLHFNDPDLIPTVYHRQACKTGYPMDFTFPAATVNKINHVEYAASKRQFGMAFTPSLVQTYEAPIDHDLVEWINAMRHEADINPVLNWTNWVTYFGTDVYTKISLGESFGFMKAKSDVRGLIKSSYRVYKRWTLSRLHPVRWLAEHTWARPLLISGAGDMKGMGVWKKEIHNIIEKRVSEQTTSTTASFERSMCVQWLSPKSADQTIPVADIEDQLISDIIGGSYAAGATIHTIPTEMAAHPACLKKAQEEIDEAFATGKLTSPVPTSVECLNLPYVNACVREVLRVNSTASPRWRASSDRSLPVGDQVVPPGVAIATSPYAICIHPKIWGEDAETFRPERWLEASSEELRLWDRYDSHWGFMYRKCPGRYIGTMLMSKSMVMLLRNFDFRQVKPGSIKFVPRLHGVGE